MFLKDQKLPPFFIFSSILHPETRKLQVFNKSSWRSQKTSPTWSAVSWDSNRRRFMLDMLSFIMFYLLCLGGMWLNIYFSRDSRTLCSTWQSSWGFFFHPPDQDHVTLQLRAPSAVIVRYYTSITSLFQCHYRSKLL